MNKARIYSSFMVGIFSVNLLCAVPKKNNRVKVLNSAVVNCHSFESSHDASLKTKISAFEELVSLLTNQNVIVLSSENENKAVKLLGKISDEDIIKTFSVKTPNTPQVVKGVTLLMLAADNSCVNLVKAILKRVENISAKKKLPAKRLFLTSTPLEAYINQTDDNGRNVLHYAFGNVVGTPDRVAYMKQCQEIVKALLKEDTQNQLLLSVDNNNTSPLQILMTPTYDPKKNICLMFDMTDRNEAVRAEIVNMLLDAAGKKADAYINKVDRVEGVTPLMFASLYGHEQVVKVMLDHVELPGYLNRLDSTSSFNALKLALFMPEGISLDEYSSYIDVKVAIADLLVKKMNEAGVSMTIRRFPRSAEYTCVLLDAVENFHSILHKKDVQVLLQDILKKTSKKTLKYFYNKNVGSLGQQIIKSLLSREKLTSFATSVITTIKNKTGALQKTFKTKRMAKK